jgi:hypothetical protein
MNINQYGLILLEEKELNEINGGIAWEPIAIAVGYCCWAFEFIHDMAKD